MTLLHVALIHPEIPYNTGNISRLCVGADAALHIVEPVGFKLDNQQLLRAGLDHWESLELCRYPSLDVFLTQQSQHRFILTTKRAERCYLDIDYEPGDFLLFGAESTGLPQSMTDRYQESLVYIPMPGHVRSINVSNAVAIVVYEALRQFRMRGLIRNDRMEEALAPRESESFDIRWNKVRRKELQ